MELAPWVTWLITECKFIGKALETRPQWITKCTMTTFGVFLAHVRNKSFMLYVGAPSNCCFLQTRPDTPTYWWNTWITSMCFLTQVEKTLRYVTRTRKKRLKSRLKASGDIITCNAEDVTVTDEVSSMQSLDRDIPSRRAPTSRKRTAGRIVRLPATHTELRVSTHLRKLYPYSFSRLNDKTLIPSLIFIFRKFYSWNTMQKTFAKLSSAVKNKIWINKWLNLKFPYFFFSILHVHFGQIQYFFKVLKTDFTIQYFQCHVGTLRAAQCNLLKTRRRCKMRQISVARTAAS